MLNITNFTLSDNVKSNIYLQKRTSIVNLSHLNALGGTKPSLTWKQLL